MTDEKQKKIFAKNLNKYIQINQKQQIDVAKDLGIKPTTLNMWCTGNSMPRIDKIKKLSDYFGIGVNDLTDEKKFVDADMELSDTIVRIALNDIKFAKIIISYSKLSKDKRDLICDFFEKFIL